MWHSWLFSNIYTCLDYKYDNYGLHNHSLDDIIGLSDVGVAILGDKVNISSVTVDVSIVVCTTVPVECDTVGCSVLTIYIK